VVPLGVKQKELGEYNSVVEHLPSMCNVLASISSAIKERDRQRQRDLQSLGIFIFHTRDETQVIEHTRQVLFH
jgi:hypothetical protein